MIGDVIIIFAWLAVLAGLIACWIKKEEYKDDSRLKGEVIGQMQAGAEIAAQRDVKRKEVISKLRAELEETGMDRNMWRLSYQGSKQHVDQLQKELGESLKATADAEMKWRNLELALQMEQKQRRLVEENLKYYMELLGEQMNTGAPAQVDNDMSRWALRCCLADALRRNAGLQRVIRRMRDRARGKVPADSADCGADSAEKDVELDAEFDSLRAAGPTTAIIQGDDAWDPKYEPMVPERETAVECEVIGFPADLADGCADLADERGEQDAQGL